MKNIGKYNGRICYTCSLSEYENVLGKGQDDGRQIFIIDGTMVRENEIIGYYDGKHVQDVYDGKRFMMPKRQEEKYDVMEFKAPVTTGTKAEYVDPEKIDLAALVNQINFADYTVEVDNFFASLTTGR